ncbi:MAG TPA: hypothetical protein VF041_11450 [Gemmatimonadaceae bacterium]
MSPQLCVAVLWRGVVPKSQPLATRALIGIRPEVSGVFPRPRGTAAAIGIATGIETGIAISVVHTRATIGA